MPFAETPLPPPAPHQRPAVVVPYTAPEGSRSESERFPNDLVEYVWNAVERVPGTTRKTHAGDGGQFVLITLPHPIHGLELRTGKVQVVLAAILHEETLPQEGQPLVTVGGCLFDEIEEATSNWEDFVLQESSRDETDDDLEWHRMLADRDRDLEEHDDLPDDMENDT